MSLSTQFLDEVRARTTLSALIGRTTRLTKAGREFKACCPFHNEKSPSFTVNDEKGFYHCFGCGAHGDAIRWMTDHQGLPFMDAVKELAAEAGMDVPAPDPRAARAAEKRDTLYDVMAEAQGWFVASLAGPEGAEARAYLATRGFDAHTIQRFGFGYAPEGRQALKSALARFPESMLIEAGLRIAVEDKEPYDRFRGRLMLPIEDARGRVIAFGGRILAKDKNARDSSAPKYLNSPDTPLFDKGRTLYNLHRAAPAARQSGRIIVVEGYMDVIALAAAGIAECVAPLGTALTEQQIELLWRQVETPILCFDGDAAGQKASAKAAVRALPGIGPGRSLRFVLMPAGKDPDDVVRSGGPEAMEGLLAKAVPLVDLLWRHEHNAEPLDTPEARAALRQRLVEHARTIQDKDVSRLYEQEFRARVDALFERARAARPPFQRRKPGERWKPPPAPSTLPEGYNPAESIRVKSLTAILRGLARHPKVLQNEVELLTRINPETDAQREVLELLVNAALDATPAPDAAAIDERFPADRGWMGLQYGFLKPGTYQPRAEAELCLAMMMAVARQEGASVEEIRKMVEANPMPEQPAEAPKGKLL